MRSVLVRASLPALLLLSTASLAKTHYVEKWGTDGMECGSKTAPCETIGQAILNAGDRDKIIVGPGVYEEAITINREGLKLESVAGRFGTFIDSSGSGVNAVDISVSKCQFGKKKKGFTLVGNSAFPAGTDGIVIDDATRAGCKIDSNRLINYDDAIVIRGEKHQVRNNMITSFGGIGIDCEACSKVLLQDNVLMNDGSATPDGIYANDSDANSIYRNRVLSFSATHSFSDGMNFHETSESNKVRDNVTEWATTDGIEFEDIVDSLVKGNIATHNRNNGYKLVQDGTGKGPKIQDNLAVANGNTSSDEGFDLRALVDATFSGNTAVQSSDAGVFLGTPSTFKSFKNNNTYASGQTGVGCGIENDSGSPLEYSKHFFGRAGGPDDALDGDNHDANGEDDLNDMGGMVAELCDGVSTGSFSSKPNPFKAKKAAGL